MCSSVKSVLEGPRKLHSLFSGCLTNKFLSLTSSDTILIPHCPSVIFSLTFQPSFFIGHFLQLKIGIDVSKQAVTAAIKWARDGANASLLRLQKAEAASEFAGFVERLISGNK
jgi:hypothetical protein